MAPTPMQLLARRAAARRLRVQGVGRAVPHVDARRLRRRAAGGHRLHVDRREGGGVRRVRARVPVGVRAAARRAGATGASGCVAAATMIVGTVVGVAQTNVKRMLAYSSIAHGGYLLVALVVGQRRRQGRGAVLPAGLRGHEPRRLRRHRAARERRAAERSRCATTPGLWNEHPALAALMTIFLLSLGGFPPLAGFIAKWYVFSAAMKAGYDGLAIIGVLTSVVSVFFYLRIVVMMYMTPSETPARFPAVPQDGRRRARRVGDPRLLSRHPADARPRLGRRVDRDDLLVRSLCHETRKDEKSPQAGSERDARQRRSKAGRWKSGKAGRSKAEGPKAEVPTLSLTTLTASRLPALSRPPTFARCHHYRV